jgi:hypothetical protein
VRDPRDIERREHDAHDGGRPKQRAEGAPRHPVALVQRLPVRSEPPARTTRTATVANSTPQCNASGGRSQTHIDPKQLTMTPWALAVVVAASAVAAATAHTAVVNDIASITMELRDLAFTEVVDVVLVSARGPARLVRGVCVVLTCAGWFSCGCVGWSRWPRCFQRLRQCRRAAGDAAVPTRERFPPRRRQR